ncbi:DNA polymerase III subunit gamma/tau [Sphingobacterium sp. SGG-5]|uniref:DNA polymerase III subunit gamma/tau n=1 Tax=Sphingobacterium sp. SGG-5 TaxID=2710881 RepID=UPI0013ED82F6|nr:DNA polymerase III subunit gamma/tau [Sphingobacterium sp. SGG-5]NGM62956.1 DNA polymerase III subunit gamma/tau [Sphingobacterium sp. SGG-5]
MDNFIVSARKYRPVTFDSVVGQQHVTNTLKNAIHNNQLAQAFLFCGPRGVGKTTCARILAKTINCEAISSGTEACGTCSSCQSFQNGASFSIHELDAASNNSVEDIRSLIEQVRIPPQSGKYKIYIIDEVHMLSQAAFNAFLKTLEEPPSYAIFILATTEKHKILPTILSRCQIFDFNRIRVDDMANHLATIADKEGVAYEHDGLHVIAQKADGGLRDALSMFDQIVSFTNRHLTYEAVIENLNILDYEYYFRLLDAIAGEEADETLLIFDSVLSKGFDGGHFMAGLANHLRNLLVSKEPKTLRLLEVGENIKKRYLEQSSSMSSGLLLSALNIANQCEINYRTSKNQRLQVELALLKMCHLSTAITLSLHPPTAAPPVEGQKKKLIESIPRQTEEATAPVALAKAADKTVAPPESPQQKKEEKPSFTSGKGWGNIQVAAAVPNLTTVFEDKPVVETAKDDLVVGNEYQEITESDFLNKWNAFAEKMKAESRITIFTIMTASTPRLKGAQIEIDVDNMVQMEQIREYKIDILNYLRVELRNFSLDLTAIQVEQNRTLKPYTSQEKYQAMAVKNPALETLRKTFNLGLS